MAKKRNGTINITVEDSNGTSTVELPTDAPLSVLTEHGFNLTSQVEVFLSPEGGCQSRVKPDTINTAHLRDGDTVLIQPTSGKQGEDDEDVAQAVSGEQSDGEAASAEEATQEGESEVTQEAPGAQEDSEAPAAS